MFRQTLSITLVSLGIFSAVLPPVEAVEFKKAEDAIKYRQSAFSLMGSHFSNIGAVVKGEKPYSAQEVSADIAVLNLLASLPWKAFGPGTEGGDAKPEIWKEGDKVKARAEKLQADVLSLSEAGKTGNLDAIKRAFGNTAQSCKGCHDNYKRK